MSKNSAAPLISDAGPLISLAENCLIWILRGIENRIIIPKGVEYEAVIHPLQINQYEFNAMRIRQMIEEGEIEVDPRDMRKKAKEIMGLANQLLFYRRKPITIIQEGEAEVLALALERGINTVIIDERTARLLVENVWQIKEYMESRLGLDLEINDSVAKTLEELFSDILVLRSTELVIFAYENGFLEEYGYGLDILKAALYALKKSGCAISTNEIEEYIALLKSRGDGD